MEKKILVVEDNSDARELLAFFFKRSGYKVIEASDGLEAIDQTHAAHPHLILMDLGLPKLTGDQATARLKADPSTKDIPVIICTAFHKGTLVDKAVAAGAAEVLLKPIDMKALLGVLRRHLETETETTNPVNAADTAVFTA